MGRKPLYPHVPKGKATPRYSVGSSELLDKALNVRGDVRNAIAGSRWREALKGFDTLNELIREAKNRGFLAPKDADEALARSAKAESWIGANPSAAKKGMSDLGSFLAYVWRNDGAY